ncbi:MAG: signal peptidase II [Desulfovibrionaceae bacterium]|jgi:signal peptidase II|nr:signal peptidase II [Desulfovibrionaceae bacterium]
MAMAAQTSGRYRRILILALGVLLLDQATKAWVVSEFTLWSRHTVIDGFFDLVLVLNKGAVFGLLNDSSIDWQRGFFIAATLLAVAVILYLARVAHPSDHVFFTGLGLVLGGALGNLVDRIFVGRVIDFLDFYVGDWHWPAFNVADIGITVGALLLILSLYIQRRDPDHGRTKE